MTLVRKDIKTINDDLDRLKPAQPNLDSDLPVSVREAVELLAPKLNRMKAQGFTLPELAAALARHNLIVKPNTLGRYLAEFQPGHEQADGSKSMKRLARPSSPPGPDSPAVPLTVAEPGHPPDA